MLVGDHDYRLALATRDAVRAAIVLATLRQGTASNSELRRATSWPGDSFRSLLRRMERAGLIVARPCTPRCWARASAPCDLATGDDDDDRQAAGHHDEQGNRDDGFHGGRTGGQSGRFPGLSTNRR
jgi:hypothetical protein